MIELKHVSAGYGETGVLHDISLDIHSGEVLALVGPNGSGKSTLLRTILGLIPKRSGEIFLNGEEISTLTPRKIAQRAAFLTQSRTTPNITARRMVLHARFPYLSYPRRYRATDYAIADEALRFADAYDLASRPMQQLSGGQRQKVYLAMSIAQQTPAVLMDEPTTYLDMHHQFQVMEMANQLAGEGKAVVLVLHDLPLAMEHAHRIAVLENGHIRDVGTPEEIYKSGTLEAVFQVKISRTKVGERLHYFCESKQKEV